MNISRRTFITAGALGAVALAIAGWLPRASAPARDRALRALNADAETVLAAIAPVMLAGALPDGVDARRDALAGTLAAIDQAVAGLPMHAQDELRRLFALLASPPGRVALAHTSASWDAMSGAEVEAFLDRLRTSRWSLLRAAYDAFHQLVFASWYGNPRAWPALGYDRPSLLPR